MSKRVYISADYSENYGDRDVVNELHKWANYNDKCIHISIRKLMQIFCMTSVE